jgi:IgA Peptidase M64/FG-GAP-like repeat
LPNRLRLQIPPAEWWDLHNTLKWSNFVNPSTPVPTSVAPAGTTGSCRGYNQGTKPSWWDDNQDVGLFEGGSTYSTGVYRPVINCGMNSNCPPACPICSTQMRRVLDPYTDHTFLNCYAGDFNGDGKSDLLIHNGNSILLYRSNGSNWSIAYLGRIQSNGSGLSMATRYDGTVPGWQMRTNDTHSVAAINGDGKADLFVYNYQDWSTHYLGRMISEGTMLAADWVADWVGAWNLGALDQFAPSRVAGRQWQA